MTTVDKSKLLQEIWPLNRTLANAATDEAFSVLSKYLPLKMESVPTGSRVFTWEVPKRWEVDRGILKNEAGDVLADFAKNPLYLASYSNSFEGWVDREELSKHLTTSKAVPDAIPFTFKFYEETWHLSLEEEKWQAEKGNKFFVDIKSRFEDGTLNYGVCDIPGETDEILLVVANICHPYIANDSITGVLAAASIYNRLKSEKLRHTVRFLVCPETIGSLAYMHNHFSEKAKHKAAIFSEMLGLKDRPLRLMASKGGNHAIDLASSIALKESGTQAEFHEFMDGPCNDEKVLNSPGFDIPSISFVRWPYQEYHTSADSPDIVDMAQVQKAEDVILNTILNFDRSYIPKRKFDGLLGLSANGLYDDWRDNPDFCRKMYRLLMNLDNEKSILEIVADTEQRFNDVHLFCEKMVEKDLAERG